MKFCRFIHNVFCISFLAATIVVFGAGSEVVSGGASAQSLVPSDQDEAFKAWLATFKAEALEKGISETTLDMVLPQIRPLKRIVERDRNQPEVKQTYARYLSARVSDWRKTKGAQMMAEHATGLSKAAENYGVQARYIAAIWGVETNYGTVPLSYSVFDAVATLAYDKRRADRFRRELFAALQILDTGHVTYEDMKGSWAGAMGQPQFMPENYLRYAVDQDGDGHPNIWTSQEDVFASIANYLKSFGWENDKTWGRGVTVPAPLDVRLYSKQSEGLAPPRQCKAFKSMGAWHDLSHWQSLGVRRLNGGDLPTRKIKAALIGGDEGDGQAYLVYSNFCSVMRYNPSFKYALSVGLLSDAISR